MVDHAKVIQRLRDAAEDPMWADHAEIGKATLWAAIQLLTDDDAQAIKRLLHSAIQRNGAGVLAAELVRIGGAGDLATLAEYAKPDGAMAVLRELVEAKDAYAAYRCSDGHAEYERRRDRHLAAWKAAHEAVAPGAKASHD